MPIRQPAGFYIFMEKTNLIFLRGPCGHIFYVSLSTGILRKDLSR